VAYAVARDGVIKLIHAILRKMSPNSTPTLHWQYLYMKTRFIVPGMHSQLSQQESLCKGASSHRTLNRDESISSSSSHSSSSDEEEDVNKRLNPFWPKYQRLFHERGLQLDTIRDVKKYFGDDIQYLHCYGQTDWSASENTLCSDPSLVSFC